MSTLDGLLFREFVDLCEHNIDKKCSGECLALAKDGECIYHPGIVMPKKRIASLYALRCGMAKESGRFTTEQIADYEACVQNLSNSNSQNLGLVWINGENDSFFVFYEPDKKVVLGVLKFESKGLKNIEAYNITTVEGGYTSNAEKYSLGIFIRDWK